MIFLARFEPQFHAMARIMIGLMLLEHGTVKHLDFPEHGMNAVTLTSLSGIAGLLELVLGACLVLGLFTRVAAFLLSGVAACAYWIVYAKNGFFPIVNGGEAAVVYSFALLWLAGAGAGPWSIDALRRAGR